MYTFLLYCYWALLAVYKYIKVVFFILLKVSFC
jgi:hypothetical protein